jgi:hypothetical protein
MSTDTPTLEDFLQAAESGEESGESGEEEITGARYGRNAESAHEAVPDDAGQCRNCGRDLVNDPDISNDTLRVIGDNHRRTPVCNHAECRADYFGGGESTVKEADLVRTVDRARNEVIQ